MIADREHLQQHLEEMKMAQATLQQLMTLSAGGLALFFSFIAKAPFVATIDLVGPSVVCAWVISLCAAAYAHRFHAELFLLVGRVGAVQREVEALVSLATEVPLELQINPNRSAVFERAKEKIIQKGAWVTSQLEEFEKQYFPKQNKALLLVRVSLFSLTLGFVLLGIGYVLSRVAT